MGARNKGRNQLFILFMFFLFLIVLSSCKQEMKVEQTDIEENKNRELQMNSNDPVLITDANFSNAIGWLNKDEILYVSNEENGWEIYTHHLKTGKSERLYKSNEPKVAFKLSPSKKYLLIHTSTSPYEGRVTIIDMDGIEIFTATIPSSEMDYKWNPYNENMLLVTAFTEDWDYHVYKLNIQQKTMERITVPDPFLHWFGEDELLYVKWEMDQTEPRLSIYELTTNREKELFKNVFHVDVFSNIVMTASLDETNGAQVIYTFYTDQFEELYSFSTSSNYLHMHDEIPYYDFHFEEGSFYTFELNENEVLNNEAHHFRLILINIRTGEKHNLLENVANGPIQCSEESGYCLYGHEYERLIDLHEEKVISLVEAEE